MATVGRGELDAVFDASPEAALAGVRVHSGPVFVDLDETLYLRNSTEDFIDLARPALVAVLLLRIMEIVKPWRWSGGESTRDVWRIQLIQWIFPWTMRRWRNRAAGLAQTFANRPLLAALKELATPPVIVSVGFRPLVEPLVAAFGLPGATIVASRINGFEDRRRGKLPCTVDALGETVVSNALLVTDSLSDLPLLRACAAGYRTEWPGARYRPALSAVYLPGRYIEQIKRPGEHYLRRAVLQEDYLLWVLTSVALAPAPWAHVAGLLLLLVSFWIVYEMGYVDNDRIAHRYEQQPALTQAFHEASVATPFWQPWAWSIVFAIAGCFVIRLPSLPVVRDFAAWAAALLATSAWFAFYNRSDKSSRVWMYAGLQFARTAIFAIIVPILPIGAMALAAHMITRWIPYYIYRLTGRSWPLSADFGIARVLVFVILGAILAIAFGWRILANWSALALLVWTVVRARRELAVAISKFFILGKTKQASGDRR